MFIKKWPINCSYNPQQNNIWRHLDVLTKRKDAHMRKHYFFLGDFNAGI